MSQKAFLYVCSELVTVDGKIYGLPNIRVVSNPVSFLMDKSLAKELNVDTQAIEDAACNSKNADGLKKYAALIDYFNSKISVPNKQQKKLDFSVNSKIKPF